MRQIAKRYAAYMLVGLGLVGYGPGCETQEAQEETDKPVVERPDQEERGQPREGQGEQARQQQQGDQLPGLADQEIGQRDQQTGAQQGAGQQQQPREQERPQGQQENLEVRGRTAGEAQLQRLDQESVAGDLKLESTEITDASPGDDQPEYAEFCFESEIQDVSAEGGQGLYVQGYDSKVRVSAQEVSKSEQDASCLKVGFEPGTALDDFSVGVVAPGIIMNTDNQPNAMDSAELEGASSFAGRTSAPELTDVEIEEGDRRAVFVFDQPIEGQQRAEGQTRRGGAPGETAEAGERVGQAAQGTQGSQARRGQVNPDWLGYYTSDGRAVTAEQVVGVDRNRVELEFEAGQAGQTQQEAQPQEGAQTGGLEEAVRWFAHRGAVMDRQGERGVITSTGQTTEAPDLASVDRESETEWTFEFDEPVTEPDATNFALYTDGGQMFQGAEASVGEDGETVQVNCPDGEKYSEAVTMAAVAPQAVRSDETNDVSNTIGSSETEGPAKRGPTSGPDLVSVETDSEQARVTFQFDETVSQGQGSMGEGQQQGQPVEGQQPEPSETAPQSAEGEQPAQADQQEEMEPGDQQESPMEGEQAAEEGQQPAEGEQPAQADQQEEMEPGDQQESPMEGEQAAEEGQQPERAEAGEQPAEGQQPTEEGRTDERAESGEQPEQTEPAQPGAPEQRQAEQDDQPAQTEPGQPQEGQREQAEQQDQPEQAEPGSPTDQQPDEGQRQAQQQRQSEQMGGEMAFYVITEEGEVHSATEMVAREGEEGGDMITVTFPKSAIESPARFVVGGGVVEDQIGNPNPPYALRQGETTEVQQRDQQQSGQ